MFDIETAVIPDMVGGVGQCPLTLLTSVLDEKLVFLEEFVSQSVVKTLNPNTEQRFMSFSVKKQPVPEDVPFYERSVFLKFDIISCKLDAEHIQQKFELFEYNLIGVGSSQVLTLRASCVVDLTKTIIGNKPFYQGTLNIQIEKNNFNENKFENIIISEYSVSPFSANPESLNNSFSEESFFQTKYKNSRFYYVLKPQALLIRVGLIKKSN
jgi:hypothetical protein